MGSADLPTRFRRHADVLESAGRSPLSVALMRGAANDLGQGGVLAGLLGGTELAPGQAPALRVLGALHLLVLMGQAPQLARYYPSVGGDAPADEAWQVARGTLEAHASSVRLLLRRPVQTNEPGRSAVLYGILLWVSERYGLPMRLYEIGASAGLNLLAPQYGYRVRGEILADPSSALVFDEPWLGEPVDDPVAAYTHLVITERRGCDIAPIDATSDEGRLTLLSYIWPDELDRIARMRAALAVAAKGPSAVDRADAKVWLEHVLCNHPKGVVDFVWQSVFAQYLPPSHHDLLSDQMLARGAEREPSSPLVWARMEPGTDPLRGFEVSVTCWPDGEETALAYSGDHGPPVRWL